jgi:hypothetical protein
MAGVHVPMKGVCRSWGQEEGDMRSDLDAVRERQVQREARNDLLRLSLERGGWSPDLELGPRHRVDTRDPAARLEEQLWLALRPHDAPDGGF